MDTDLVRRCLEQEPLPGKRVIDFGCGEGEIGLWMAGSGAEVYLVDFTKATVDSALDRARAAGLERRVRGILVQGTKLDMFADRGFDLVLTRGVPERELLRELARAMKPDGRIVVAGTDQTGRLEEEGFGAVAVVRPERHGGWLGKLLDKRKRGEAVLTARRAG